VPETTQVSVLIPLYRGRNTIKACLESLVQQKDVGIEILLLDNGCPEKTGEWAGFHLAQQPDVRWKLFEEPRNVGFARAMNRLYSESSAPWILFLNQDVTLEPDHVANLVSAMEKHPDWGGVCGILLRSGEGNESVIDTTGHVIFRDRIVRNRGAGKNLSGESFPEGEVFGISAACALYRRAALDASREKEGPFDPDFFSYFEDIDQDYRMHRAGWKLGFTPSATGRHALAGSGGRRELPIRIRAYGNRTRILWKHESVASLLPDLVPVMMQDIFGSLRALVTDPISWLVGPWLFIRTIPSVLARRARMSEKWGNDMSWLRPWLLSERDRWQGR
jgi:GT2 family glycosyltransferase